MKKLLIVLTLMLALTGCTRNNTDNTDKNNNNKPSTNETTPNDGIPNSTSPNSDTNNANNTSNTTWYDQFELGLRNSNFTYTAKTSLDPTPVGGVEGYRYMGNNGYIDVYRFDEGEKLNQIKKDKKIKINGEEKNVEVNGHWVMVDDQLSDDVLSMFRGLK